MKTLAIILTLALAGCGGATMSNIHSPTHDPLPSQQPQTATLTFTDSLQQLMVTYTFQCPEVGSPCSVTNTVFAMSANNTCGWMYDESSWSIQSNLFHIGPANGNGPLVWSAATPNNEAIFSLTAGVLPWLNWSQQPAGASISGTFFTYIPNDGMTPYTGCNVPAEETGTWTITWQNFNATDFEGN